MTFPTVTGVHLLPSTGEFAYDTISAVGFQRGSSGLNNATILNFFSSSPGAPTDYTNAITNSRPSIPECKTVSLVIAWFFNSEDASTCNIYPSTNFILGEFEQWRVHLRAGQLERVGPDRAGLPRPHPAPVPARLEQFRLRRYASDPSVVRCIRDLKAADSVSSSIRSCSGQRRLSLARPHHLARRSRADGDERGRYLHGRRGGRRFHADPINLTVAYSGGPFDWTFRRMILHYANLCVVAGGVGLFVIGSELRGLETLRGPAWTKAGTVDGSGNAVWDYPMVARLNRSPTTSGRPSTAQGLPRI